MPPAPACPDPDALRAFALGKLADSACEVVAAHVEACPKCLDRLDTIDDDSASSGDALVQELRQRNAALNPIDDSTVDAPWASRILSGEGGTSGYAKKLVGDVARDLS